MINSCNNSFNGVNNSFNNFTNYVKSIRLIVKSAYGLEQNAPTSPSEGFGLAATRVTRAKAVRESARMVLMNIIVFAIRYAGSEEEGGRSWG